MAVSTAVVALSPSTVAMNQPARATVTITNDAVACNITNVTPIAYIGAATNIGNTPEATGVPSNVVVSLAGAGTTVYSWDVIAFTPQLNGAATATLIVGCVVTDSSGKVTAATTANLTVNRYP